MVLRIPDIVLYMIAVESPQSNLGGKKLGDRKYIVEVRCDRGGAWLSDNMRGHNITKIIYQQKVFSCYKKWKPFMYLKSIANHQKNRAQF